MVDSLVGVLVSWLVWLNRSVGWLVVYSWNSAVLRLEARCQLRKAVLRVNPLSKVKKPILYSQLCRCNDYGDSVKLQPLQLLSNLRSTRLLALQDEHNGEKGEDDHRMVKSALHCLMMLDAKRQVRSCLT